jgi:hypothetical protein
MRKIVYLALALALAGFVISGMFYLPRPAQAATVPPPPSQAVSTPVRAVVSSFVSDLSTRENLSYLLGSPSPKSTPHGNTPTPSGTPPLDPVSSIENTYNYSVAVPFNSLTDTIVGMADDLVKNSYTSLGIHFNKAMDLFYNMAASKPLLIASGSELGNYPVLGNFSGVPKCDYGTETENVLACYMVRGWTASRNIALFLLPITLMLTVGAALRNCSTSVTGYADAREAFINWFFSVGETLISLWAIGLALGLSYAIASSFLGFFPEVQNETMSGVFDSAVGRFFAANTGGDQSLGANITVVLLYVFAIIMLIVTAITVIGSVLAQNIILLLLVIICPFIFILCTVGPMRWFQGVWWKAMILCLFFAPINRILMTGAMVLMQSAEGYSLILAFIFAIALLSIMCTLNFGIVKIVYGSAMEVAGKVTSTVMGVLDLAAAIGGFAIAGPAGAAVGGAIGGAAGGAASNAMPSGGEGGSPMDSAAAGEQMAQQRERGAAALSGFGNALSRTNIPGLRGFGAGLSGGASADGRSASMDEAYFRGLRETTTPLHSMEDVPQGPVSISHPSIYGATESIKQQLANDSKYQSRLGFEPDFDGSTRAYVGMINAERKSDPTLAKLSGQLDGSGKRNNFNEFSVHTLADIAKVSDPSLGGIFNPSLNNYGREKLWFDPNPNGGDGLVAAQYIAAHSGVFGSSDGQAANPALFGNREGMSNPDLYNQIKQRAYEFRVNNKDWGFSQDPNDRSFQKVYATMVGSKPWEILKWKP